MRIQLQASALVILAAIVAAPAAHAQYRAERPYRGLFGGGGVADPQQSLIASGSLGGGFDNNVVADALFGEQQAIGTQDERVSGGVGQASGSLAYSLNTSSLSFNASSGTTVHYYPSLESRFMRRYFGSVGASVRATREITLTGTATYMPYSLSSFYPYSTTLATPGVAAPDIDFSSSLEHYLTYSGGVSYLRQLSRRTRLGADYTLQRWDGTAFSEDYTNHTAGGRLIFEINRGLNLRAGYQYSAADYGPTARQFNHHFIDAGVDYNRPLSFSRRTTLSISTGTSATSNPDDGQTRLNATGSAQLTHEIGRTWAATVSYARGVNLDAAWGDVVTSDSANVSYGGLISRRLSFESSAQASTGHVGFVSSANSFESYYGNASLGYALTRHLDFGVTYAYYRHRFDSGVALPTDFVNQFNRHSVRASVSVWAPLFQRARRANAAR